MKPLAILHTESSIGWGGQEIRILTEMAGFVRRGCRVHLLTPASADIFPAAEARGLSVSPMPMVKKTLPAFWAMRSWLAQHAAEYDIINTHSSTDSWLVALAAATLPHSSHVPPIVRTRHVSTAVNNGWTTRWLYQRATSHIVTTGEALKQQLQQDNSFSAASMTSVRTGIDLDYFRPLDKTTCRQELSLADVPTVGILATLRDWKGHAVLLEAWAQLRAQFPQWQLLMIGDGPYRQVLQTQVEQLNLLDCVYFAGNQHNVATWLSCLDIFTLPSWGDEGVPQGIMQAMACGLPVVSTPVGAISEAVQADSTGLLVDKRNPAALAAGLQRLMSDASLRHKMGQAGYQFAQENFGIDVMLDKMTAVFMAQLAKNAH